MKMKKETINRFLIMFTLLVIIFGVYIVALVYCKESKRNEFFKTDIDCALIFDKEEKGTAYQIEFEIRARKPGSVMVYQQNGSGARYEFRTMVDVSEEWERKTITVIPYLVDVEEERSMLAFYGEYGTGVIPYVKNAKVTKVEKDGR